MAYSKLEVDWSKASITSTGEINGRRIEQWSLPIIEPVIGPMTDSERRGIESAIADAKLLERVFAARNSGPLNEELRRTLRNVADALQLEFNTAPEDPARSPDRRILLIAAAKRLMIAGQMNPDDVKPAIQKAESALSWPHQE